MQRYTENRPRARKLIDALRNVGYSNYGALADLVDNSLDARAKTIRIGVRETKGDVEITIADDGCGMDWKTLDEALRLGAETNRDPHADLGLYGMGLDTATLSICQRTEVLTRTEKGRLLKSAHDVKEIVAQDDFVKFIGEADEADQQRFASLLPGAKSGTIVTLSDCDRLSNRNPSSFAKILKKHLGQIFRVFLASGRTIYVNGDDPIEICDPLMLDRDGTQVFSDDVYPISYRNREGEERTADIRIRIALLPQYGPEVNTELGILPRNQGFYVLRNYREILTGELFGLWTRHNTMNRCRGEIYLPGTMDTELGAHFTKQGLSFSQSVHDQIARVISGQIRTIKKRLTSEETVSAEGSVSHEEAARLITRKSPLLIKPPARIEKRNSPAANGGAPAEPKGISHVRKNLKRTQLKPADLQCRFETVSMSAAGPIYDRDMEGRVVIVKWNVDHPFYRRFILDRQSDQSIIDAVDYLVYCLATAELTYALGNGANPEHSFQVSEALLDGFRNQVSTNMRVLLSD
jgi:hypothetical protein